MQLISKNCLNFTVVSFGLDQKLLCFSISQKVQKEEGEKIEWIYKEGEVVKRKVIIA